MVYGAAILSAESANVDCAVRIMEDFCSCIIRVLQSCNPISCFISSSHVNENIR